MTISITASDYCSLRKLSDDCVNHTYVSMVIWWFGLHILLP